MLIYLDDCLEMVHDLVKDSAFFFFYWVFSFFSSCEQGSSIVAGPTMKLMPKLI